MVILCETLVGRCVRHSNVETKNFAVQPRTATHSQHLSVILNLTLWAPRLCIRKNKVYPAHYSVCR